jgi:hypothetical protein
MTTESQPAIRGRIRFPDISPRAYEHPADRGALVALRAIPGFDAVLKAISGAIGERSVRLLCLASGIRVSPRQYPEIHQLLNECATTLDLQPIPELYISRDPVPNAMAIGLDKPIIVITTGMLDLVDSEDCDSSSATRWGTCCRTCRHRTMMIQLINIAAGHPVAAAGFGDPGRSSGSTSVPEVRALLRPGRLLCSQDPKSVLRVHASLAGAEPDEMDIAGFLDQAKEYESKGDVRDSLLKIVQVRQSHPLAALRAAAAAVGRERQLPGHPRRSYPRRLGDKTPR